MRKKAKLVNITPPTYSCGAGPACPAVYLDERRDKFVIIGKIGKAEELGLKDKVSKDEAVVVVDSEMIRQIFQK